ncbi:anti-SigV factor [Gracilibacillus boraciitolerans JCM 21714]|uniref:Anti-SigV factor n=2 Tax=Gracilibacillus boraciitolerans TaxID=307521 RepID=W4VND2_9BACI|nr:anti-SigV factor [Gracilibacillus boraciitolerans JCM 21714]
MMPYTFPVRIETHKISDGHNKTVFYPQVAALQNQALEGLINHAIINQTQQLINEQIGNMPTAVEEMIGLYEVKNNQRKVLSLSLSNYTYHYQAAHGMTYIKSLTFDLEKGEQCKLSELFKPGSNYVERLSSLVDQQIKQRDIPLLGEFTGIRPDQDFYIADKTLVIYFQLYEITPYVYGFPMFPISVYDLQDIIVEDGPLGQLAVNN